MATTQGKIEDETLQPFEKAPIYKCAKKILCNAQNIVAHMPNRHKYVTGEKLNEACLALIDTASWAYVESDLRRKVALLRLVTRKTMGALILHRIANDLNLIASRSIYIEQVDALVSILKQANGWIDKTGAKLASGQQTMRAGKEPERSQVRFR